MNAPSQHPDLVTDLDAVSANWLPSQRATLALLIKEWGERFEVLGIIPDRYGRAAGEALLRDRYDGSEGTQGFNLYVK